ncbi:MAG: Rieske (2Fe-2S) protein [Methanomassiliicoccales archaeon]
MRSIKVAKLSELSTGTMMGVEIEGKHYLLANVDGKLFAMSGLCSHMAGRLWEGTLDGYVVKCPKHGSRFDVRTGEVVSQVRIPLIGKAKPLDTYKTSVVGEDIFIEM